MAIYQMVSVRDIKANAYNRPAFVPHLGLAIRSFQDEVNRAAPDNIMNQHPEDFFLFHVGLFNDETGEITPKLPELIAQGDNLITRK